MGVSKSSVQQCMQKFIEAFDDRFRFRGGAGYREIRAVESLLGVELPPELIEMLSLLMGSCVVCAMARPATCSSRT